MATRSGSHFAPPERINGASGKSGKYAYCFLLYGTNCESYFLGIQAAAWALCKHLCVHSRILLHTTDVPYAILELCRTLGLFTEVVQTEYIKASEVFFDGPSKHQRFSKIVTKWQILGLDRFDKVLFLDADLFIRANLDALFDLEPPAAMVRGPHKPAHGKRISSGMYVNAGVMLLRPDKSFLATLVEEVTGQKPRRLSAYNSPDADYLTEHPRYRGEWTSLDLAFNYQLEFDKLDLSERKVRFSVLREAHFSEAGADIPWEDVKAVHFSGMKPWAQLLEDPSELLALEADSASHPSLAAKLSAGIREYAQEVATLQGLCSQLRVGEGLLWRSQRLDRALLLASRERARARLHAFLPAGGSWFDSERGVAVWIPPNGGLAASSSTAPAVVLAYLEVRDVSNDEIRVGDSVHATVGGERNVFEVTKFVRGRHVELVRRAMMPEGWHHRKHSSGADYYFHYETGKTQWAYPALPKGWEVHQDMTEHYDPYSGQVLRPWVYYHNRHTGETSWHPPEKEVATVPLGGVELAVGRWGSRGPPVECTEITVWRRCFAACLLGQQSSGPGRGASADHMKALLAPILKAVDKVADDDFSS